MKPNKDGWKPLVIIQCYEDRQPTLPLRKTSTPAQPTSEHVASSVPSTKMAPPPPPPMPPADNSSVTKIENDRIKSNGTVEKLAINGNSKEIGFGKVKPVSPIIKTISNGNITANGIQNAKSKLVDKHPVNGTLKRTPTPDYETTNVDKLTAKLKLKTFQRETAEVDSIESYKMKNPNSTNPKPPPNYFMRAPDGTATMKKTGRPVSIKIGEYPSTTLRKEPSKLGFLNGDDKTNGDVKSEEPIGSRLQSELAMTLSRSNLRKKTDLQPKLDNNGKVAVEVSEDSDQTPDTNFHKRYGNNLLPTPPPIVIPKVPVAKTNSHPVSKHIAMLAGKVSLGSRMQNGHNGFEQTPPPAAKGDHQAILIGK